MTMGITSWMLISAIAVLLLATVLMPREQDSSANDDPSFELYNVTMSPGSCFSESYQEAREKFREAATKIGAELHSILITGEDYTTDIAILKGTKPGIVGHSSGVHGVEGYAGSAIQVAWMNHFHDIQNEEEQEGLPTMIFVHAVNPYGMAHFHRTNENNVDLNRNALYPDGWEMVLGRDHNIAFYDDFSEMFNPPKLPWSFWVDAIPLVLKHGVSKLKKAMVTGQYHYQKGIFYGGNRLEPSWDRLLAFMKDRLEVLDTDKASKVTWIDIHTGLGKSGEDTIMNFDGKASPEEVARVYEGSVIPGRDTDGNKAVEGYDLTVGYTDDFVKKIFQHPDERDVWVTAQEFGTTNVLLVAKSLVLENTIRHHEPSKKELGQELMKEAFYVRKISWRKSILTQGIRVLRQSIQR